jgi:hypothetical protein
MIAFVVLAFAFVYDYGGAAPHAQVLRQNGGKSMFASSRLAGFLAFNIGTLHQLNSYIFMHSLSRGTTYVICLPGIGSNSYSSSQLINIWFYFCGQFCGVCGQFCGFCGRFWICALRFTPL